MPVRRRARHGRRRQGDVAVVRPVGAILRAWAGEHKLAAGQTNSEARGKERAQELEMANARIKELEAKLNEKKP